MKLEINLMQSFRKKDFYFSIVTGLITGFLAWRIFEYLEIYGFRDYSFVWLMVLVPILWILGVLFGYFLGKWMLFFNQFGKFAAIGFTNAAVYFGILNILISWSDINTGLWYSVFVATAFIVGTVHSYFWNKFWVFSATDDKVSGEEFGKFVGVSVIAGLVNV